jgi:endonuclease III
MQLSLDIFGLAPMADVRARLLGCFGPRRGGKRLKPVDRLVDAIVSSRTYDRVSSQAFLTLWKHFPNWEDLMLTPVEQVHALIKDVTFAEEKAPCLIDALKTVHAHSGCLSLEFLNDLPPESALRWLEKIKGVGRKISAAVLNFSTLHGYAFVIDTHVLRISQRLGWIPENTKTTEKAYEPLMTMIPGSWDGDDLYEFHWLLKKLGQSMCTHARPECARCPLSTLCPSAKLTPPPPGPRLAQEATNIVPLFPENPKKALYEEIAEIEHRSAQTSKFGIISFDDQRVDSCFQHGGLERGRWHEIGGKGSERETPAAATGFTVTLAQKASDQGAIIWVLQKDDLYAPALIGIDPDRLIFVKANKDEGVLATLESAARTAGVTTVIGELGAISLTNSRRLQLACEQRGAIAFVIRRQFTAPVRQREEKHASAATRWRIASLPSETDEPGLGPPRWSAMLERNRNGRTGAWIMEAQNGANVSKAGSIRVVAELGDHTIETGSRPFTSAWSARPRDDDAARKRAAFGGGG